MPEGKGYGQFDMGEGTRYAKKGKAKRDARRTPRRDKQVARGTGMPNPSAMMADVKRGMKRGRHRAPK